MKLVEIIRGRADQRRDAGPRLRLRDRDRQDADRRQRFARLLHQPRLRHLRHGRRDDARRRRRRRRSSSTRRSPPACRSGRSRCSTRPRSSLSVHVMEQTRADLAAEGRSHVPSAGEQLVESMVKELERPGPRRRRRLLRLSARRAEAPLAGAEDAVREAAGAERRHRELDAALPLPAVDRDRALPGRRRADEHARGQHRLDLRHRLSGLDRRRDPVHRLGGPRALPRPGRRARRRDAASASRSRPQVRAAIP